MGGRGNGWFHHSAMPSSWGWLMITMMMMMMMMMPVPVLYFPGMGLFQYWGKRSMPGGPNVVGRASHGGTASGARYDWLIG